MENIEYSEWVPAGALVKGLFVMVSLIVVVVTFAFFIFSEELLVEDILGISLAWVILAFPAVGILELPRSSHKNY